MNEQTIYRRHALPDLLPTAPEVVISLYDRRGVAVEVCDEDLDALAGMTDLKRLDLRSAVRVTDVGLAKLPTLCPALEHLSVHKADITARGLDHLARLPALTSVNLWGLERLDGLGALAARPLTHVQVRDSWPFELASLGSCRSLTRVKVNRHAEVTATDLAAIAALPALRHLSVFGRSGLAPGAVESLSQASSLETLHIGRPLSDAEVSAVAGLPALKKAYLRVDDIASLERLAPLADGLSLRLYFKDIGKITDAMLARIVDVLPRVEGLNLDNGGGGQTFGADGLAAIGKLSGLRFLNLGGNVKNVALASLTGLGKLEGLNLHGCHKLTGGVMKTLSSLSSLRRLNADGIAVSDAGLKKVADHPLEVISVDEAKVTDKGLTALKKCTTLREVRILPGVKYGTAKIGDVGVQALATLPHLGYLELGIGEVTPEAFAALARCPNLRYLRLQGDINATLLTDEHLTALSTSASLEVLTLGRYAKLGFTGAGFEAMARIPTLKSLHCQASPDDHVRTVLREAGVWFECSPNAPRGRYVSSGVWSGEGAL